MRGHTGAKDFVSVSDYAVWNVYLCTKEVKLGSGSPTADVELQTEWASCIASSQSCPTDFEGSNITFPVHANCMQGSVPPKYIAVSGPSDVQAGINFARANGIPIVVKNTGHDFRGRSASQNALALWTHTYQPPIKLTKRFIPAGCSVSTSDAVTFGAGQQFDGIYQFAEVHNITIVGGGTSTVGAAGGWITGGWY